MGIVGGQQQQQCEDDVCVRVRVRNFGDRAGGGRCQLVGTKHDVEDGDTTVFGPIVRVPVLEPGTSTTLEARWSASIPEAGLRFLCEPGLRL